jgi:hypothetical protein
MQDNRGRTEQPRQDTRGRTARIEHLGQDKGNRAVWTGLPGQEREDRPSSSLFCIFDFRKNFLNFREN